MICYNCQEEISLCCHNCDISYKEKLEIETLKEMATVINGFRVTIRNYYDQGYNDGLETARNECLCRVENLKKDLKISDLIS